MYFKAAKTDFSLRIKNSERIENPYHIVLEDCGLMGDYLITYYINDYTPITLKEYRKILSKFNTFCFANTTFFCNKEDAERAANYLNEKYAVIINLIGER